MQKIVSKYALAAHLAVMAVAPLLLLPFAGTSATASTMLWLTVFGIVWLVMEPSRRRQEMPHEARIRVVRTMIVDPLFWLSLVLIVFSGIRALNGGIGLAYDAELMIWSIRSPAFSLLPGCVDGTANFSFVTILALAVIFQGTRHALGRSARSAFLLVASLLSSIAAIALAIAISYRHHGALLFASLSPHGAAYFGTAFGIQLLCGLVALFNAVGNKWVKAEPFAVIGMIGNAIGLVLFSPPLTVLVFLGCFLLLAVLSFVLWRHYFEGSGSFRCALAILMALGMPALYALSVADSVPGMSAKLSAFLRMSFFSADYWNVRSCLSSIALKTWKSNPWLGTGFGSFPIDIRFGASAADWSIISPIQATTLNGWWQMLAERGVIGVGLLAVMFGMLLWTYGARLIGSFSKVQFTADHFLGLVVLLAMIGLTCIECSLLRPEVLLLVATCLSFSGGAFPERLKSPDEKREV